MPQIESLRGKDFDNCRIKFNTSYPLNIQVDEALRRTAVKNIKRRIMKKVQATRQKQSIEYNGFDADFYFGTSSSV